MMDFLAAAHAELSCGVPQKVADNVACAAGTFVCGCHMILWPRSWPAHVAVCRRRHGPILRLIGSKYAWTCLLLVTPCERDNVVYWKTNGKINNDLQCVRLPLRAGRDCKCVVCLSHPDLLQTNCPHSCFCMLTPPRCKKGRACMSTGLMRWDSAHDCALVHIFGVWCCANSGKMMGLSVNQAT